MSQNFLFYWLITRMSPPTKECFIDERAHHYFAVSGHDWKYITQRRQSTLATMLTINLRVRGPCRKCGRGEGEKKVVLADEKGAWRKRTLHLKRASVNTEIEKMEQRERGEGRYEWEQFVSAELCSLRGWRIPFFSMTGLKQRGETGETTQAK